MLNRHQNAADAELDLERVVGVLENIRWKMQPAALDCMEFQQVRQRMPKIIEASVASLGHDLTSVASGCALHKI